MTPVTDSPHPIFNKEGRNLMADLTLDARNLQCPMPVVKAKKAIDTLQPGQVLEVLATDPGSKADFAAWSRSTGNELILATQEGTVYRYNVRKR
ncbi:MAG: preprotein translocase subunit TatB [Symbiobacteriaceae bacterium]|jgi:TusA-related sulfurtransferase|nr:preprotein translocase subunit TatB [Symbiobacteriaceae bacterium]